MVFFMSYRLVKRFNISPVAGTVFLNHQLRWNLFAGIFFEHEVRSSNITRKDFASFG